MEGENCLYACVEAGVALAGFSALMIAFRQREPSQLSAYDRALIATLVERGLMVVCFALLPILLLGLGLDRPAVWAVSSAALALYFLSLAIRTSRLRQQNREETRIVTGIMFWPLLVLGMLVMLLQGLHRRRHRARTGRLVVRPGRFVAARIRRLHLRARPARLGALHLTHGAAEIEDPPPLQPAVPAPHDTVGDRKRSPARLVQTRATNYAARLQARLRAAHVPPCSPRRHTKTKVFARYSSALHPCSSKPPPGNAAFAISPGPPLRKLPNDISHSFAALPEAPPAIREPPRALPATRHTIELHTSAARHGIGMQVISSWAAARIPDTKPLWRLPPS